MIKKIHRSWLVIVLLLFSSLVFYILGSNLENKTKLLIQKNKIYQSIISDVKILNISKEYLDILKHPSTIEVEKILKDNTKMHYITLDKIQSNSNKEIEVTITAELDTDIFDYLNHINKYFRDTLSIQEIGLFRNENALIGKLVFKRFSQEEPIHE